GIDHSGRVVCASKAAETMRPEHLGVVELLSIGRHGFSNCQSSREVAGAKQLPPLAQAASQVVEDCLHLCAIRQPPRLIARISRSWMNRRQGVAHRLVALLLTEKVCARQLDVVTTVARQTLDRPVHECKA